MGEDGWLAGWLAGRLAGWLAGWLAGCGIFVVVGMGFCVWGSFFVGVGVGFQAEGLKTHINHDKKRATARKPRN